MKNALPASKARQLFEDIAEIKQALAVSNVVSEREAAHILGIEVITLQVYVSKGKVPQECYTKSPITHERFYFRDHIIGLKKQTA